MARHKFYGIEEKHNQYQQDLLRDTRPLYVQLVVGMRNQVVYLSLMSGSIFMILIWPATTLFCLLFGLLYTVGRYLAYRKDILPLRLPSTLNRKDYGDPLPDDKSYDKAGGVYYLGNERNTDKELWASFVDIFTHMIMYAGTGGGKTEALVSSAYNFLAMGGGLSYIDAKAATKLGFQLYTIARLVGRDHDFRVLNYGVSCKPPRDYHPKKVTNTNNPFNYGSAESMTQFVAATIPQSNDGNAIFGKNAQVLITAAMFGAREKRDSGAWDLDVTKIRDLLTLPAMVKLVEDPSISGTSRNAIKQFLVSVGWQEGEPMDKQGRNLHEQFSYARAYFSLFLASLSDTYGHIYKVKDGEVDLQDILKNRRILCVMIPSVEKTIQETQNVGNILLSGLKNALVACIGDKVMGTVEEVLDSLPIDMRIPYGSITDEHAAINTPGYELFQTQGRGFGCVTQVATQDRGGLYKADEHCAQQMESNSKISMIGSLDDCKSTWEFAQEKAGEVNVIQTSGDMIDRSRGMAINYEDQKQTQVVKICRVEKRDLQEQTYGQFHIFFKGRIIRARTFFANPPLKKKQQLRINDMLPVPKPDKQQVAMKLQQTKKGAATLIKLISKDDPNRHKISQPAKRVKYVFDNPGGLPRNDVAIVAFKHWVKGEDTVIDDFLGGLESREQVQDPDVESPQTPEQPATEEPEITEETPKKKEPAKFTFAPKIFRDQLNKEPETQKDKIEEPEEPTKEKPTNRYDGFKLLVDGTTTLFNDQTETVAAFKKDWVEMEELTGASHLEAVERSDHAAECIQEASQDEYPDTPPPEKPDVIAKQQMNDYMQSLLNDAKF